MSQNYQTRQPSRKGQSFWTHLYEPQLAHSHRQHLPVRATIQWMLVFIRHLKPQLKRYHYEPQLKECHVFTLVSSHNSRDIVSSHNSRNTLTSWSLRYHPKPCRPRTSKTYKPQVVYNFKTHYAPKTTIPSTLYKYLTMDPIYNTLPRTCPFVVLPLQTSLLVVQLYRPPRP